MWLTRIAQVAFLVLPIALLSIAAIADVTISGVVHDVEGQPLKQIVVTAKSQQHDFCRIQPGPGREIFGGIEIRF